MYNLPTQEAKAFIVGLLDFKLGYIWMAVKVSLTALFYLGLCTAPLLPITSSVDRRVESLLVGPNILPAVVVAGFVTAGMAATGHTTPVAGNTLFDFGLGVRTLQNDGPFKTAPPQVWWAIVFLAVLGAISSIRVLLLVLADAHSVNAPPRSRDFHTAYAAMLLAILAIYNLPFLTRGGIWFDRYALPNLALFGLLMAPFMREQPNLRGRWTLSWLLMCVSLIFSVIGTHDYLEWNGKRWEAASDLARTHGVDFTRIDAGFEYNNYQPRQLTDHHRAPDQVLLSNPMAEYRIAFSPLPRHIVLKVIVCRTWLYGSPSAIFVLRSEPGPSD